MRRRRCVWRPISCPCGPPWSSGKQPTEISRSENGLMKADKIRNQTDAELQNQERQLADQLFKLKFQLNMGQTESLKKIRGLRKDIARVKTILREQELVAARNTEKK